MPFDPAAAIAHTDRTWRDSIEPALADYITVPALSVAFDPEWADHGFLDRAVEDARAWVEGRSVPDLHAEVVRLAGRSPLLWFEVDATSPSASDSTVLMYGHLDKQPPMTGWHEGLGPWQPVLVGDRLYGRGGADDGYAVYASVAAIEAVRAAGGHHGRIVGIIECSEESGSPDLPDYVEHLAERIGEPDLVVCLDSFCGDYERLWTTTSLRGLVDVELDVEVLTEGVHSGSASGVVADSFRLARLLLERIEDSSTGRVLVPEAWAEVPSARCDEIEAVAHDIGAALVEAFPFVDGPPPDPSPTTITSLLTARTWEPTMTVIGADGLPPVTGAGNVLRPHTRLALSFRLPPTVDAPTAAGAIVDVLSADPPQGAKVTVEVPSAESGWDAPPTAPWLADALRSASLAAFGAPARSLGEGGSIPFMGMLGRRFPAAQFMLTGVLGPGSNAHGPNEFLHLPTGRRVTAAVAMVLDAHVSAFPAAPDA